MWEETLSTQQSFDKKHGKGNKIIKILKMQTHKLTSPVWLHKELVRRIKRQHRCTAFYHNAIHQTATKSPSVQVFLKSGTHEL